MEKEDVRVQLRRDPFVPLRVHLAGGKSFDVPFPEVAHLLGHGVLVLKGVKRGTHQAQGFDVFGFDQITRIERRPTVRPGNRRKAS
jgi:hypothetical protein